MVTITKKEALEVYRVDEMGYICNFHMDNPDQQAIMETCEDCFQVQDPCGCLYDSICEECHPEAFKDEVGKYNG